jgi:hypothetical protein
MYATEIRGGLDYAPCRYGKSRVTCRGPKAPETGYIACLGGTETFGRFVPDPWPVLLGDGLERPIANFGQINAGLDLYLNDAVIAGLAASADAAVLQVMGAANMSNRFYSVHPRRNDRFVKASDTLQRLYPEVDFSQISFVGALIATLIEADAERFGFVMREVQTAWVARMKKLLDSLSGPAWLLWMGTAPPPEAMPLDYGIGREPAFITRDMLDALKRRIRGCIEVVEPSDTASTEGMVFSEFDAVIARQMLGVAAHERAADALSAAMIETVSQ